MTGRWLGAVDRFRNVGYVAVAVGAGVLVPGFGSRLEPLVTPLVILLVYGSLRGWRFDEVEFASYGSLVALSLGISYVLLPLGGMRVANALLADGAVLGFAVALSVPTTVGSAIIWTRFSGGDVQLATTISIVSLLLAPVATPVVLTRLVDVRAAVPTTAILVDLLTIIVGGALLAAVVPARAVPARAVDGGSTLAILLLIYTSVAGVESAAIDGRVLAAIVVVSVLLLLLGLVATTVCGAGLRLDRARVLPLFFASSLKNLGIALLVALPFAEPLVVVAIITYYVVQQLAGAAIADAVT
ncbi:bile acid:sodium symporter [Halorarum salinum]|uniref:Bile acid:sodium symporter n=1 Tax=Halorarum salinum TaxID=2743089 RepID=A0A7D5L860_9EURY|nr:bile acid:sodium symporter [Halobaculum salinum]QLG60526.1 bile acid:sodium symporter [Halobaculum salinum]